jgi:hypothetical protein
MSIEKLKVLAYVMMVRRPMLFPRAFAVLLFTLHRSLQ